LFAAEEDASTKKLIFNNFSSRDALLRLILSQVFYGWYSTRILSWKFPEAVFLVVCDPTVNELW
jgi:hypothetical protein